MVQQEVIVHVQLVEHPAQGVLANGQDAGIEPCEKKRATQLTRQRTQPAVPQPGAPYCVFPSGLCMRQIHALKTGDSFGGNIFKRETIPSDDASVV